MDVSVHQLPFWISLLEPDDRTEHQPFYLFFVYEECQEKADTYLEPPGRFLSKPRRFLSAKDGLQQTDR